MGTAHRATGNPRGRPPKIPFEFGQRIKSTGADDLLRDVAKAAGIRFVNYQFSEESIASPCCGCISAKCTCEGTDEFASFRAFHGNAPTGKRGFAIASEDFV